jgi:putative GTP pyrophosphokinase
MPDGLGVTLTFESSYNDSKFSHELVSSKDYLTEPKADGYRGIHLIYRQANPNAIEYEGLSFELQIRTRLQHAWATPVETMGTFLGQALKSGQGEEQWREFIETASAALSDVEKTTPVPGFEGFSTQQIHERLCVSEQRLRVLEKLSGFAIATDQITTERGQGGYHLIILNSLKRTVSIRPFPVAKL